MPLDFQFRMLKKWKNFKDGNNVYSQCQPINTEIGANSALRGTFRFRKEIFKDHCLIKKKTLTFNVIVWQNVPSECATNFHNRHSPK